MASGLFNPARQAFGRGEIDWEDADVRALLVVPAYTFDPDDAFVADLVAHELSAANYARVQVTGRQVGPSAPTYFLADAPLFPNLGTVGEATIGMGILFVHTGNDATARLVCACDVADQATQALGTRIVFANGRVFSWGG